MNAGLLEENFIKDIYFSKLFSLKSKHENEN